MGIDINYFAFYCPTDKIEPTYPGKTIKGFLDREFDDN